MDKLKAFLNGLILGIGIIIASAVVLFLTIRRRKQAEEIASSVLGQQTAENYAIYQEQLSILRATLAKETADSIISRFREVF